MSSKIEKVLLIFPATPVESRDIDPPCKPPLGLAYVAAVLRKRYDVRILDATALGYEQFSESETSQITMCGLRPVQMRSHVEQFMPDVVGVSALFSGQMLDAVPVCEMAKQINPSAVTVLGGPHPSFLPESCLCSPHVDFVVHNEGEHTLSALLGAIERGEGVESVPGVSFRRDGGMVSTGRRPFVEPLDCLPFPARDLLPMDIYFRINWPHVSPVTGPMSRLNTTLITSRGCPYRCCYCSSNRHWGYRYRHRETGPVIQEMAALKETYRIEEIQFFDDNLTLNLAAAKRLFRAMIEARLNLHWCAPNGLSVWRLDDEALELMKESGCYSFAIAIESGSQEVLDNIIHKPLRLETVKPLVRRAQRLGVKVHAFMMIGFPGETMAQIKQTLRFAGECGVDLPLLFVANPLPGSDLFEECRRLGYLGSDYDLRSNHYFLGHYDTPDFTRAEIEKLVYSHMTRNFLKLLLSHPRWFGSVLMRKWLASPRRVAGNLGYRARKLLGASRRICRRGKAERRITH